MTREIFRGGMQHDISSQIKGILQIRCHECIVHDNDRSVSMGDFSDRVDVVHLQQRIRDRFKIHRLGWLDSPFRIPRHSTLYIFQNAGVG